MGNLYSFYCFCEHRVYNIPRAKNPKQLSTEKRVILYNKSFLEEMSSLSCDVALPWERKSEDPESTILLLVGNQMKENSAFRQRQT